MLPDPSRWSLTHRQLVVVGGSLSVLAALLALGGSWFIASLAERMSDRMLAGSVQTIIDTVAVEKGGVTLEIPPAAFGMLEETARDNVYYSVHQGERLLTGYPDFPRPVSRELGDDGPHLRYDHFLGQRIRVATGVRHFPQTPEPVVVQVAETLDERKALARTMFIGLGLLEATLVAFATLLIRPAIRWGLRPIIQVQNQIAARDPNKIDFAPLEGASVTPELSGLINGFNQLLNQLGEATARSRRFTADASHQIRTPLAVLRAHVELLQKQDASSPYRAETVEDILVATDRLQRLLTQLLALARAEQEADDPVSATSDAAIVVQALCMRLAPQAADAGMELHFDAQGSFVVDLPQLLLEELVTNLIDNSIRYSRGGNLVSVLVAKAGPEQFIEIADDGPGIPQELHAVAVERFFRMPRDQRIAGSGLGLSIAAVLAERAGGKLTFHSRTETRPFAIRLNFPQA